MPADIPPAAVTNAEVAIYQVLARCLAGLVAETELRRIASEATVEALTASAPLITAVAEERFAAAARDMLAKPLFEAGQQAARDGRKAEREDIRQRLLERASELGYDESELFGVALPCLVPVLAELFGPAKDPDGMPAGWAAMHEELAGQERACCDLHGRTCEPWGELCCDGCTEARHAGWTDSRGTRRHGHPAGEVCSNPDLSGNTPGGREQP